MKWSDNIRQHNNIKYTLPQAQAQQPQQQQQQQQQPQQHVIYFMSQLTKQLPKLTLPMMPISP